LPKTGYRGDRGSACSGIIGSCRPAKGITQYLGTLISAGPAIAPRTHIFVRNTISGLSTAAAQLQGYDDGKIIIYRRREHKGTYCYLCILPLRLRQTTPLEETTGHHHPLLQKQPAAHRWISNGINPTGHNLLEYLVSINLNILKKK
jgi:hypothetical protein